MADSYNHRLKELDPATATITTLAGSGAAGYADGTGTAGQLSEPGGLTLGLDGAPPGAGHRTWHVAGSRQHVVPLLHKNKPTTRI